MEFAKSNNGAEQPGPCWWCNCDPACGMASVTRTNDTIWLCHDDFHSCYGIVTGKLAMGVLSDYDFGGGESTQLPKGTHRGDPAESTAPTSPRPKTQTAWDRSISQPPSKVNLRCPARYPETENACYLIYGHLGAHSYFDGEKDVVWAK